MTKTKFQKVLARKPNSLKVVFRYTGKKTKDGKRITEELIIHDFTSN